jgi:hypothetical protein
MRYIFCIGTWLPSVFIWSAAALAAQGETIEWIRQLGSTQDDTSYGVSADGLGSVYISGRTNGSIDGTTNGSSGDAFVSKYDAAGTLQWTRQLYSLAAEYSYGVSADGLGSVYITGSTTGSLGGPNAGNVDAFVTKYDAAGTLQWTRQLGTSTRDEGRAVSADGLGNVYIAGHTNGSLGGSGDAFISKYDTAGVLQWTRQFGTSANSGDWRLGVSADGLGNVYISGHTFGSLGGPNAGGSDAFVSKYDAVGNFLWSRQWGTSASEKSYGVSADGLGSIYISGIAFVSKYDAAGNLQWTGQVETSPGDFSFGVSADGLGNVYISGFTYGSFGGPNAGDYDAFVSKYDAAGNFLWTQQLGTVAADYSYGVSADGLGNVYFSGFTSGSLGGLNAGGSDAFVAKIADPIIVPEPSSLLLALAATGVFSLVGRARRHRKCGTLSRGVHQRQVKGRHLVGPALLLIVTISSAASAEPLYNIVPLGFHDLEHTRNDGFKVSGASLKEAAQVSGYSNRYNGGSTQLGQTVWLYDGAITNRVGLVGSEHTRNDGYKFSAFANGLSGYSLRYNGGSADMGRSVWYYDGANTVDIGFTGPEHTRNDGYKYSNTVGPIVAGRVRGYSNRYDSGSTDMGRSAWLYNGVATIDVGFTDPEYTRSDGYKFSEALGLNKAGQVAGYSNRYIEYNGGTYLGQSAWLFDGTTTIDIGLTGPEHISSFGNKRSGAQQLNEAGQVLGNSLRFDGGGYSLGNSVWLYDGTTTIEIGLVDAEHTSNAGYRYNGAWRLNEAGHVIGTATRLSSLGFQTGESAWLYNGSTTINIGLTDSEHTRSDGWKDSRASLLNEAGQVLGSATRYGGLGGYSAWLYNGSTTVNIGLTGPEHTRSDDFKRSFSFPINRLNEAGQVVGYSDRYNGGSTELGYSVWLYDGANTIEIGLTGPEHTRSDGYRSSWIRTEVSGQYPDYRNEAGRIIGYSERFNGGNYQLGQSAWLYNGATTREIGLTGADHTFTSGYKYSIAVDLNEAGQVIGRSHRYIGSSSLGGDAWLYDPVLDQTIPLRLSTSSGGFADSSAYYLGEDGLVLGTYTLFDTLDNRLGDRAFFFTIADGLHDLGALVDGGLPANGWEYLANAIRANGRGQILGYGKLTSQSAGQMPYLLTPTVPEPSTILLLGCVAGAALVIRARFRRPYLIVNIAMVVCFAAAPMIAHAATLRTVALSGQQAPGTPDGVNFSMPISSTVHPVLNDAGQTAFKATLTGSGVDSTNNFGIWSEGSGSLALVAREGDHAPGTPSGVNFSIFDGPVLNDAGQTAFKARLTGSGVDGTNYTNRRAIWLEDSGSLALVPGSLGVEGTLPTPALNDAGQVALIGACGGSGGICIWSGDSGSPTLVVRLSEYPFNTLYSPALNDAGRIAFIAGSGNSIWSDRSGSLTLVARGGDQAPGTPNGVVFDYIAFYQQQTPELNDAGQTAFTAEVTGSGVDYFTNRWGIWSEGSGSLALVARYGDHAPGTPSGVNFGNGLNAPFEPVLNNAGQVAFKSFLTGSGVDSTNDSGIWSDVSGSLALVAREGDHAPGMPNGVVFADRIGAGFDFAVELNDAGQIAFQAKLTDGTNSFGIGIWATDRAGALQLIARTGDLLEVAPGDFRTIGGLLFGLYEPTGNSDGRGSGFNNSGQLAFWASFTDGTSGIFVSNRVAVPEPSTLLLGAITLLGLFASREGAPRSRGVVQPKARVS